MLVKRSSGGLGASGKDLFDDVTHPDKPKTAIISNRVLAYLRFVFKFNGVKHPVFTVIAFIPKS
jgi:hypothetical protein